MNNKLQSLLIESRSLIRLAFSYKYFLIFLFPLIKLIEIVLRKRKTKEISLFINDNNMREIYIALLLSEKFEVKLIYKKKPSYLEEIIKKKIDYTIYSKFYEFYFSFIKNSSTKVLFCANPLYLLPFTLIKRNIICSVYDTIKGQSQGRIVEFFEKINVYFIKFIIERDPRLHTNYKKIYKKIKVKNVFIHDKIRSLNSNCIKKKNKIHAVSLGWIDDGICRLDKTFEELCKAGVYIHIFNNNKNIELKYPYLKKIKDKYSNYIIFEKPIYGEDLIKKISSFHIGISPHQQYYNYDDFYFLDSYYSFCPSQRVADYLSANLTNLVSKKYKFIAHTIKKYGGEIIYFEDINKNNFNKKFIIENFFKNKTENKKKYFLNKNFFNDGYKSNKLISFIDKNF